MTIMIAGGVVIEDISKLLPRHKTKQYSKRTSKIERIYIHHSGRLGRPGIDGPINSTKYIIRRKKSQFPGAPYHFWIPFEKVYTNHVITKRRGDESRTSVYPCYTIYRLQPDNIRCYHTGRKANHHGIGVALQGNTSTDGISDFQIECLEALIPWLLDCHNLELPNGLSYHAEANKYGGKKKASCPGIEAKDWIDDYRGYNG